MATTKAAEAAASAERAQQAAGCDGTAQSISAIDTQGLLTEIGGNSNAQALLDELALRVATQLVSNTAFTAELLKYVAKSQIVNNLLATETGNVLDAVQGKALVDMIGNTADLPGGAANIVSAIVTQNSNLSQKANAVDYALINLTGMNFTYDQSINTVGFQWMFGANREYGFAINISADNGGMQFYYLSNGTWIPSWSK